MTDPRTTDPASTPNERLQDSSIRHLLYLLRLQNREANWIVDAFEREAIPDLLDRLESRLRRITERGYDTGPATTQRLLALLDGLNDITQGWGSRSLATLTARMEALAAQEAQWQDGALKSVVAVETVMPATALLSQAILERPFDGMVLSDWFGNLAEDTQRRLEQAIRQGLIQGETNQQIVQRVRGTRAMGFADGVLATSTRNAEAITRTAVIHSSTQARQVFFEQNADLLRGVQWVSTLDSRTCSTCGSLDSKFFPGNKGPRPPAHVNCLPGDSLVLSRSGIAAATKRWFNGELVRIRTASGRELACTPNHPILTDGGWAAAQSLDIGSKVVCDGGSEWESLSHGENENVPAPIHDVAEAFLSDREVVSGPVPVSAPDFHGDGAGSKVAIVGAYRHLVSDADTALAKQSSDLHFERRAVSEPSLTGFGSLDLFLHRMLTATRSCIRRAHLSLALFARHFGPLEGFGLRLVPNVNASLDEPATNNGAGSAELIGDGILGHSGVIEACNRCGGELAFANAAQLDTGLLQDSSHDFLRDSELASKIIGGSTGPVFTDEIVSFVIEKWSGHVFNLETGDGFYSANGIITHNCRCTMTAVLKDRLPLADGERSSATGPVPASLTYNKWLKRQPQSVVEDALGKTRAKLFAKGKLSVDDFVNRRGDTLTLDQLRRKEPDAFAAVD